MRRLLVRPAPTPASSTSGFTLLEVLVVVIIVAILAAIAAPDWFAYLMGRRVTVVRDEIRQVLEEAQATAITTRQAQVVRFSPAEERPTVSLGTVGLDPLTGDMTVTLNPDSTQPVLGGEGVKEGMLVMSTRSGTGAVNTTDEVDIAFNYQGVPVDPANPSVPFTLPLVVDVTPDVGGRRSCVVVTTLLGNFKNLTGDECATITTVDP